MEANLGYYPDTKVVVLFSGGLDSTVLLKYVIGGHKVENVTALTILYGQKHEKELECAKAIAKKFGVRHIIRDLSSAFEFSKSSLLSSNEDIAIPEGSYLDQKSTEGVPTTYVPFRNGLFLSYAAAVCYSLDGGRIYFGAHSDDAAGDAYPDCTPIFRTSMGRAILQGTGEKVSLNGPFIYKNKADIVRLGLELDVPFDMTWSCYNGEDMHCGICSTCIDRKKAFKANNIKDPVPYKIKGLMNPDKA